MHHECEQASAELSAAAVASAGRKWLLGKSRGLLEEVVHTFNQYSSFALKRVLREEKSFCFTLWLGCNVCRSFASDEESRKMLFLHSKQTGFLV